MAMVLKRFVTLMQFDVMMKSKVPVLQYLVTAINSETIYRRLPLQKLVDQFPFFLYLITSFEFPQSKNNLNILKYFYGIPAVQQLILKLQERKT
ncbi:CLUMA_CG007254, isoform A [Clunio marinus]|uniref:CLUMA_CG007254, isoform A n=1 Tax=Clunio marinus TaxID=568069 RepID=A0A1J1I4C9_9DIPT|nr:CLUMA_CG007254, isoform A [Clunio marinus]